MEGQQAVDLFPFEVSAPSAQRVHLWGTFAQQARTQLEMDIVEAAFTAFWWELAMVESVQHGATSYQNGEVETVVRWLDLLVDETATAKRYWDEVGSSLGLLESRTGALPRWVADASEVSERLGQMVGQFADEAVTLCGQWGLVLPDQVLAVVTGASLS